MKNLNSIEKLRFGKSMINESKYDASIIQMDTIEVPTTEDQTCLFTLLFVQSHFLMAFNMNKENMESFNNIFDYLKDPLETDVFRSLFQMILTDNGSELYDPDYIEYNGFDEKSRVFYCDPKAFQQKGPLEVTH